MTSPAIDILSDSEEWGQAARGDAACSPYDGDNLLHTVQRAARPPNDKFSSAGNTVTVSSHLMFRGP